MPPRCRELLLLGVLGCRPAEPPPPPGPPHVVTTTAPVDWLVRQLVPEGAATVELLLPGGQDAATWAPSEAQLTVANEAALVVFNGAGFEPWVATSSVPLARRVDTTAEVALVAGPQTTHAHGSEGSHTHAGPDPHTWLDPARFAQQAAAVAGALARVMPTRRVEIEAKRAVLDRELRALDQALQAGLACWDSRTMAAHHPTWTYWADRAGVEITLLSLVPGEEPSAESADAVLAWASTGPSPTVLWEAPPGAGQRGLGGMNHVLLDPLESAPGEQPYDYLRQAQANMGTLRALCAASP